MAIGCCDACDAQDVPGSRCGSDACTDGFFCFLCQGDEFDPYCEMVEVECSACDGEGADDYGRCEACHGTGGEWIATQPVTLADHAEIMAQFDAAIDAIKKWVEAA